METSDKQLSSFELTWMARILYLYRHEASLFSSEEHRKALLAAVWQESSFAELSKIFVDSIIVTDPQPFLNLQLGRIDDIEAKKIVDSGSNLIEQLKSITQERPLKLTQLGSPYCDNILDHLKKMGFKIDPSSYVPLEMV